MWGFYKIRDDNTGLYHVGGCKWGKKGKVYNAAAHVKVFLTEYANRLWHATAEYKYLNHELWKTYPKDQDYGATWQEQRNNKEWRKAIADFRKRQEEVESRENSYKYLPENWTILLFAEGGVKEIKSRDFYNVKDT